ncbi:hypothetical protein BGX24_010288 [Mortierella sp. AD032]|nr:hypothetical protein BGX24_010288 [Mortierella sp. AD032]
MSFPSPEAMSITVVSTPIQDALSLSDVLQALGSFLTTSELYSCVLVCHQWNYNFTPWLWRTIDDSMNLWGEVLGQIEDPRRRVGNRLSYETIDSSTRPEGAGNDERWLRNVLTKHGKDIRHLHLNWVSLLSNASRAGTVTRLRSLAVHSVRTFPPFEEVDILMNLPTLAPMQYEDILTQDQQKTVFSTCMLSPAFDKVLQPVPAAKLVPFLCCLMASQRLCLLIMDNPDLETVELSRRTGIVTQVFSQDYVVSLLGSLPRLKRFRNHCLQYNLQSMLEQLPTLQHYETSQHLFRQSDYTIDNFGLTRSFPALRSLNLAEGARVRVASVLKLLEFLPGLEQLTLGSLQEGSRFSSDPQGPIREKKRSHLQGFHITHPGHTDTKELDEAIAGLVIPCMPFLTMITLRELMPETAAVLAEQCKQLESLKVPDIDRSLLPSPIGASNNFLALLLHGCPRLRHLYATRYTIHVDKLLERPIVCRGLETFCCRIVGLKRLTPEEQAIFDTSKTATPQEEDGEEKERAEQIQEKQQHSLDQHRHFYDTFAGLTQLTNLDLGFNHLVPCPNGFAPPRLLATPESYLIDGRVYFKGYDPTPDTLLLSLNSGLGRLQSLKKLKAIGFQGLDHRVGVDELKWMVKTWPKLEKITGVSDYEGIYKAFGKDCPRTRMLNWVVGSLWAGTFVCDSK